MGGPDIKRDCHHLFKGAEKSKADIKSEMGDDKKNPEKEKEKETGGGDKKNMGICDRDRDFPDRDRRMD